VHTLAVATRSGKIESIHEGLIYVTDSDQNLIFNVGDPNTRIYMRSTAKPFLAVSLVYSGAANRFGISPSELAVISASHTGEKIHRDTVASILKKIGLSESDLLCGSAEPENRDARNDLVRNGLSPSPLYNCCSGKHAGILALCRFFGLPIKNYTSETHPVKEILVQTIAEMTGRDSYDITLGYDNCCLFSVMLPIKKVAGLYSLLAAGSNGNGKYAESLERIKKAMIDNPLMVCGDGEFCTELIENSNGRVIGKVGSDGIYCAAVPGKRLGICVKIMDGSERAVYPVITRLLYRLGILSDSETESLERWAAPAIRNHRGQDVGYVMPVFEEALNEISFNIGDGFEAAP
jgi:L-asparaginase II